MKKFNTIAAFAILVLIFPFMQSCLDVEDEMDGLISDNLPYNAALATVITPSEIAGEAMIENDNEGNAFVVNPDILTRYEANNEGQRIFYNYVDADSPIDMHDSKGPYIKITDMLKILTKPIDFLKEDGDDIYGNAGIYIMSHSLSKKYLTLQFQIMISGNSVKHRISLVAREGAAPDEHGYLPLELRHNPEGDKPEGISGPGYVSFLLEDAPGYKEGTLKGLNIKYETINYGETNLKVQFANSKAGVSDDFTLTWENKYNTQIK